MTMKWITITTVATICVAATCGLAQQVQATIVGSRHALATALPNKAVGQEGAAALDARARSFQVWVKKEYYWENVLTSELTVNGKTVNIFNSDSSASIGPLLAPGWNRISVKTSAPDPSNELNSLLFTFGPVQKSQDGKLTMNPPVWGFGNGSGWKHHEGKRYVHALGPVAKEVEVTYSVYYAGLEREAVDVKEGDYAVIARKEYYWDVPVTATVYVNETPITTFLGPKRQVIITSLLKPGKNVIKVVTARVTNSFADNDTYIDVVGPAEWVPANSRFEFKPILRFDAMQGWTKHPKTGVLIAGNDPSKERLERTASFFIN